MANQVLRTIYIDPDVDDELRTEAFDTRTSKNDLICKYLRLGMQTARNGNAKELAMLHEQVKTLLTTIEKLVG